MLEKSSDSKWGSDEDYIKYKKTTPILLPKKPNFNQLQDRLLSIYRPYNNGKRTKS